MGLTLSWEEKLREILIINEIYKWDHEIGISQYTTRNEEIFWIIRNILEDNKKDQVVYWTKSPLMSSVN